MLTHLHCSLKGTQKCQFAENILIFNIQNVNEWVGFFLRTDLEKFSITWLKIIAHWVFLILSYSDAKAQKIELDPIFLMMDESFGGCV